MDDVPLSNVAEREQSHGTFDDLKTEVRNTGTTGKREGLRSMSTMSLSMSVIGHLILVSFTVFIIIVCFLQPYSLFLWHPSLMTIGTFLLMAEAIMAMSQDNPISGKFGRSSRVQIHWVLQAIAASLIFIGFLVIVINKNINNKHHFHTWHSIFGLITVIMVGMASSGGVATLYSISLKQFLSPALMKLIHNVAGILTYVCGTICMILAMYSGWFVSNMSYAVQVLCIILITVSAVCTLQSAVKSAYVKIIHSRQ